MSVSCHRLIDSYAKLSEDAVELNDDSSQRVSDLADIRPNPGRFPEGLDNPTAYLDERDTRETDGKNENSVAIDLKRDPSLTNYTKREGGSRALSIRIRSIKFFRWATQTSERSRFARKGWWGKCGGRTCVCDDVFFLFRFPFRPALFFDYSASPGSRLNATLGSSGVFFQSTFDRSIFRELSHCFENRRWSRRLGR